MASGIPHRVFNGRRSRRVQWRAPTRARLEAIAATLPLGSLAFEPEVGAKGEGMRLRARSTVQRRAMLTPLFLGSISLAIYRKYKGSLNSHHEVVDNLRCDRNTKLVNFCSALLSTSSCGAVLFPPLYFALSPRGVTMRLKGEKA
jgi:hypothetical protein